MDTDLNSLREHWEGNANEVAKRDYRSGILVVVRSTLHSGDRYRCLRYFHVGTDHWTVSCDGDSVTPEVAMKWLCNPSASTCRGEQS